jgi:hypothetical protein
MYFRSFRTTLPASLAILYAATETTVDAKISR